MREDPLSTLIAVFVPFSLAAVGGGASIFAGIQHESVDVQHWLTAREFLDLFAISRASPGPGSMLVTLIGWHVAGWTGAALATLALFIPSSLICYAVARIWNRYRGRDWHAALEKGLAPVAAGLILAGVVSIARLSDTGYVWWAVALFGAGVLAVRPKTHPLLILLAGGAVFAGFALANGAAVIP